MLSKLLQILTVTILLFGQGIAQFSTNTSIQCPRSPAPCCIPCKGNENENSEKVTVLTFYIEQKAQQEEDFIQLSLAIKQKDTSLKKAIEKAAKKVELVKTASSQYCKKNNGQNCQQTVDVNNFKVEPSYQIVRRQPIFNGFIVAHEVKIVVKETQNVGELVDSLLGLGIYQIQGLQWKPLIQIDSVEKAIDKGINQARDLCGHINRKIGAILSITEIYDKDEQEKDEEQGEANNSGQDQQDEQEPSVLKFQVQCIGRTAQEQQAQKIAQSEKSGKKKKKKADKK